MSAYFRELDGDRSAAPVSAFSRKAKVVTAIVAVGASALLCSSFASNYQVTSKVGVVSLMEDPWLKSEMKKELAKVHAEMEAEEKTVKIDEAKETTILTHDANTERKDLFHKVAILETEINDLHERLGMRCAHKKVDGFCPFFHVKQSDQGYIGTFKTAMDANEDVSEDINGPQNTYVHRFVWTPRAVDPDNILFRATVTGGACLEKKVVEFKASMKVLKAFNGGECNWLPLTDVKVIEGHVSYIPNRIYVVYNTILLTRDTKNDAGETDSIGYACYSQYSPFQRWNSCDGQTPTGGEMFSLSYSMS